MAQIPGTSAPARTSTQVLGAQHPLDGGGGIDETIPVRVVYTPVDGDPSAPPFIIHYARQRYSLLPGVPTFIPYLAMCMYCGDPRAINVPNGPRHTQYRQAEVDRLRVHWGVYENDNEWARVPDLKAYPIDSDTPFNTVLDDPDGVNMDARAINEANNSAFIQSQMEDMASKMRVMQAQLLQQQQAEGARSAAGGDPNEPLNPQMTTSRTVAPEGVSMVGAHPTPVTPASKSLATKGRGKGQGDNTNGATGAVREDGPAGGAQGG